MINFEMCTLANSNPSGKKLEKQSGLTPIFGAVLEGSSQDLVALMVSRGANITSHTFQRKSALQVASERGFSHLLQVLDPVNQVEVVEFVKCNFTFNFCTMCRKSADVDLTPCETCGIVAYCSHECKANHWKVGGHKDVCMAVLTRMDGDDDEE